MTDSSSHTLFERSRRVLPGGVNSPARAFRAVGGSPPFLTRGRGARVWDEDGREYIDYVGAWGPLIFGHAYSPVLDALVRASTEGVCFGAPTRREVEYAELLTNSSGWVEQIRVMNSGAEATTIAARLARAITGRARLVKFEGGYHGHGDAFVESAAGAGADVRPLVAGYNDLESVRALFATHGHDIAAVFVEPVAANMGVVAPRPGFLAGLRELCAAQGALLVFDEVVTGFRLARGGASEHFGVRPDLVTYGKVAGGGLPIGVVGGARALMSRLAPEGDVFHAGTFAGNPMTMAAGTAQLRGIAADPALFSRLESLGAQLESGLAHACRGADLPWSFARVGSLWTLFFVEGVPADWPSVARCDTARFARFFHELLRRGVAIAPSQFEANFISAAHTDADIAYTVDAISHALRATVAVG